MRRAGIVVDAVPGVQHAHVLAHLHLQLALDHDVAFLSFVSGQLDVFFFRLGAVGRLHVQGLRNPVPEGRRHVVVHHVVGFLNPLSFALAGHREGIQVRAGTFDNVPDVHAERQRAAVKESEVQIAPPHLAVNILLLGHAGLVRHLRDGEVLNLAKFADPVRHLLNLVIQSRHLCHGFLHSSEGDSESDRKAP